MHAQKLSCLQNNLTTAGPQQISGNLSKLMPIIFSIEEVSLTYLLHLVQHWHSIIAAFYSIALIKGYDYMRNFVLSISAALMIAGCSTSKPYTGEVVTTTTDPSGLKITKSESRTLLPGQVLAGNESELRQLSAEVVSIDKANRKITLRTVDGNTRTIVAGEGVKNFPQIKVKDQVSIDYFASVNFEVRPPLPAEVERAKVTSAVVGGAPKGSKPAGIVAVGDIAILKIDEIDKSKQTVKLSGPNGSILFKTNHPENLDLIKRGDDVVVEVAALLAARVSPKS